MVREIYNKNAREKALLEEAYQNVYKEKTGKRYQVLSIGGEHGQNSYVEAEFDDLNEVEMHLASQLDRHGIDIDDWKQGDFAGDLKTPDMWEREEGSGHLYLNVHDVYEVVDTHSDTIDDFNKEENRREFAKMDFDEYNTAYGKVEDAEGNTLEAILPTLEFKETTKQAKQYQYAQSSQNMPAMSYTVVQQQQPVVTVTSDGKETENVAEPNDIIMSGPSREQYVVKPEKFIGERGLYTGKIGGTVTPEQSPRIVARVENITQPVTFKAPWGEDMILKRGDYLVKDGDQGYYRIAQKEYDETYNAI